MPTQKRVRRAGKSPALSPSLSKFEALRQLCCDKRNADDWLVLRAYHHWLKCLECLGAMAHDADVGGQPAKHPLVRLGETDAPGLFEGALSSLLLPIIAEGPSPDGEVANG